MSDETSAVDSPEPIDAYEWYGFDTENDDKGKVTVAALVSESGQDWIWPSRGYFREWLESRTKPTMVICHNLEYDLVNEFGRDDMAEMQLNYLKGRLISARSGPVKMFDSFNHFRMGLIDIGKAIGIEKKEMDIYSADYVKTDAWICLKVMTQARDYIASLGGQIGATSGSSSLSVWAYMTDSEFFNGPFDTPWLRKGYYGGRTEIFTKHCECDLVYGPQGNPQYRRIDPEDGTLGEVETWGASEAELRAHEKAGKLLIEREQDIAGYDINSMYPFCMLNEFPESYMDDPGLIKAKGMAEITISVPHDVFVAPLCYRTGEKSLIYPVGVFSGVWTYDEIREAEKLGAKILQVHKAVGGNCMVRPFDQFINTLYDKRKASTDSSERLFLKVLMNALYGKIASKNEVTRTVSRHHLLKKRNPRIDEVKWITYHRGLLDYHTPQQPYVNVLWGSMITAYSRLLLARYMRQVPPEKLLYSDTDSVYTHKFEFEESPEIGCMKLEKRAGVMHVVQPKAYQIDSFYRAKGVPKPRVKDGVRLDFARDYVEKGFAEFEAPIRFRASINSKRGVANQWIKMSKSRKTDYSHKRLSGNRYFPPVVGKQLELTLTASKHKGKAMVR